MLRAKRRRLRQKLNSKQKTLLNTLMMSENEKYKVGGTIGGSSKCNL